MVRLSVPEVRDWLSAAYLPAAIEFCLDEFLDDVREQEKFIRSLVKEEYVIVDDVSDWANFGAANPDWSGCRVGPYPTAMYDDWYSRTGEDCFPQFLSVMYKSTGEPFSEEEVEWVAASVLQTIEDQSETGAPWNCSTEADENALYIFANEEDSTPRVDAIKAEIQELRRSQLLHIARELDLIISNPEFVWGVTEQCLPKRGPSPRPSKRRNDHLQERIPVRARVVKHGNQLAKYLSRPISRASKSELVTALFKALRWKRLNWHEIKSLEKELAKVHGQAKRRPVECSAKKRYRTPLRS
jgi:hypothetical protein